MIAAFGDASRRPSNETVGLVRSHRRGQPFYNPDGMAEFPMTKPEDFAEETWRKIFSEEEWREMIDEETCRTPGERNRIASAVEAFLATNGEVPVNELFAGFTDYEQADIGGLLVCMEVSADDPLPLFRAGGWPALFQEASPGLSSQRRPN
jgi:hypothetical protein